MLSRDMEETYIKEAKENAGPLFKTQSPVIIDLYCKFWAPSVSYFLFLRF